MPRSTWSFSSAGRLIFDQRGPGPPAAIRRLVQRPMIITDLGWCGPVC